MTDKVNYYWLTDSYAKECIDRWESIFLHDDWVYHSYPQEVKQNSTTERLYTDKQIEDMLNDTYAWIQEYREKHSPMSSSNIFISMDPAWKDKECTTKFHYEWDTLVIDEIKFIN